jgi:hypothetical protein
VSFKDTPRSVDDLTLEMIRLRVTGYSVTSIGEMFGFKSQYVSTATNRVRDADIKHDPSAKPYYWQPKCRAQRRA